MLNLYFVRHGQTEWNVVKRIQGHMDSELTEKGIRDAERLGTHLKHVDWTTIYSSPSKRTFRTAEIIKGNQPIHIQQDDRLLEMHLGHLEGCTMEEIKRQNADLHFNYWNKPSSYNNETGESFHHVKSRVNDFMNDILQTYQAGNLLIVTHGVVIKTMQVIASQLPLDQLWETPFIDGTSVTKIKVVNDGFKTELAGDLTHLK